MPPPHADAVARDRGSTSLTTVLLTPVFMVIAFMAFQAALWSHARTEARAVARDSAALVARNGALPDDVERSAAAVLAADTDLTDAAVVISSDGRLVTARVTGEAPGLVRGMSSAVDIVVAIPVEGFRP
jgi:TadE-like protein